MSYRLLILTTPLRRYRPRSPLPVRSDIISCMRIRKPWNCSWSNQQYYVSTTTSRLSAAAAAAAADVTAVVNRSCNVKWQLQCRALSVLLLTYEYSMRVSIFRLYRTVHVATHRVCKVYWLSSTVVSGDGFIVTFVNTTTGFRYLQTHLPIFASLVVPTHPFHAICNVPFTSVVGLHIWDRIRRLTARLTKSLIFQSLSSLTNCRDDNNIAET
jgi:hypothetical protein